MNKIYDLVIVGGGVAGLSLASSLLHSPLTNHLRLALVEANSFKELPKDAPTSNRTSSLTPTSVRYLQANTAWEHIKHDRIQTYSNMHVYDGISDQQIEFQQASSIATMVENANLQTALMYSLRSTSITHLSARVKSISKSGMAGNDYPHVQLDTGEQIQGKLLVGADGANSPVRAYASIDSHGWDYPHHGVVGTLTHGKYNHDIAHQRMLPSGPVAFLPLAKDKAALVWSIHPSLASKLKSLNEENFAKLVNAAFRLSVIDLKYILNLPAEDMPAQLDWRLSLPAHSQHAPPEVVTTSSVASFPLRFRHADTYHAERVVLIGDAAHTIHPLAGQGLNLALLDCASLQSAIEDGVKHGTDIGFVGEQLSRDRYWANARVAGVVDKIHKLYAREEPSIVGLRSLGSGFLDKVEFAKRAIMSAAG